MIASTINLITRMIMDFKRVPHIETHIDFIYSLVNTLRAQPVLSSGRKVQCQSPTGHLLILNNILKLRTIGSRFVELEIILITIFQCLKYHKK